MFKKLFGFTKKTGSNKDIVVTEPPTPLKKKRHTFTFTVRDMDTTNDQGKDIQEIFKKYIDKYCKENDIDKFSGLTDSEIKEEKNHGGIISEFDDVTFDRNEIKFVPGPKGTLKILIDFDFDTLHIGKISTEDVKIYKDWYGEKTKNIQASITGGNVKKVIEENQKKKIVKEKQPLGVVINLYTEELI